MLNDIFIPFLAFISAPLPYCFLKWHFYKKKIILKQEMGYAVTMGITSFVFFWGFSMALAWSFIEIFLLAFIFSTIAPSPNPKHLQNNHNA